MPLLLLSDSAPPVVGIPLPVIGPPIVEYETLANIVSADWSLMLDATAAQLGLVTGVGAVVQGMQDIEQCIAIILSTPKGSDYLRPHFACDVWRFIDAPLDLAVPHIVREVVEALTIWEPRISVTAVTAALAPNGSNNNVPGNLVVSVTWQLKLGVNLGPAAIQEQTTVVTITPSLAN